MTTKAEWAAAQWRVAGELVLVVLKQAEAAVEQVREDEEKLRASRKLQRETRKQVREAWELRREAWKRWQAIESEPAE